MGTKKAKSQKILLYSNNTNNSIQTEELLKGKLEDAGFTVVCADETRRVSMAKKPYNDTDLIICVGGDGTFLQAIHMLDFPTQPIVGINTGHLGFFQEVTPDAPDALDMFIRDYLDGKYALQPMQTVKALVKHGKATDEFIGLNEIIVRSADNYTLHLDISIGGSFIERFSGDGILIATPAGSTAYNYSLGGSIVDPRLNLLQVTPMAPMNTTAYRSFTSSLLLPPDLYISIVPEEGRVKGNILIAFDSLGKVYESVDSIDVKLSDITVNLLRFENYDFWNKVKTKFL